MPRPPDWWDWDLDVSPHLLKRIKDRSFNEADLRAILEHAHDIRPSHDPGPLVVECRQAGRPWEVVVESDAGDEVLIVITAYAVA